MNETYLYPYSAEDARRRDELTLWRASHKANIACKEAIEEAVRSHFDGAYLDEGCLADVLREFGYKRTAWVLANTVQHLDWDGRFSPRNKEWARQIDIPQDKQHNIDFIVTSHPAVLDGVVDQYREAYQALGLFGPEQCEPDSCSSLDYEGKVLVLSPEALGESCWSQEHQLWYAHDGFGCSPHAIGRSIRCTCLGDGEEACWERTDFVGVLKEDILPDWAREKLAELGVEDIPLSRAALEESLSQKIREEWAAYEQELLTRTPQDIVECADEIAAARLCRDELSDGIGHYSRDLLDFLNTLPQPLEYLRDQWMREQDVDHAEEMTHAIWSLQEEYQNESQTEMAHQGGMTME